MKKIAKNRRSILPTPRKQRGFSLAEIVVVLGILAIFVVLVANFQTKIFQLNRIFQGGAYEQTDATNVIKSMASDIRSMSSSSGGAYPIDQASTSTLSFYNDVDDDGVKEKIRYYLSGTTLKKGVIEPTGSPLTYNPASEVSSTLISGVRNGTSTPIFSYYDTNYSGSATSSLPLPINVIKVRLVYINVVVDNDPNQPLAPISVTTQVSLRNLKDNT